MNPTQHGVTKYLHLKPFSNDQLFCKDMPSDVISHLVLINLSSTQEAYDSTLFWASFHHGGAAITKEQVIPYIHLSNDIMQRSRENY
jgi:hypothetical protein